QAYGVETVQLDRIADGLHVGRNILRHAGTAADEAVLADQRELVHGRYTGQDRLLLDGHVPGELRRIGDDHAVSHVTVVREMHVGHDEARLAERGFHRLRGAAVDCGVLADHRPLAYL